MTDFKKIAKSIVVHFAHICAYGVETVNTAKLVFIDLMKSCCICRRYKDAIIETRPRVLYRGHDGIPPPTPPPPQACVLPHMY